MFLVDGSMIKALTSSELKWYIVESECISRYQTFEKNGRESNNKDNIRWLWLSLLDALK